MPDRTFDAAVATASSSEAVSRSNDQPTYTSRSRVRKVVLYVDGDKMTYEDLVHGALKGMLGSLDPHSEFMEPEKYKELQNDTQGAFGGLGIVISMKDNFITVIAWILLLGPNAGMINVFLRDVFASVDPVPVLGYALFKNS